MTVKEYKVRRQQDSKSQHACFSLRYNNKRFPASLPSLLLLEAPHEQQQHHQQQHHQQQQRQSKLSWANSSNLLAHGLELDYNPQLMAWQAIDQPETRSSSQLFQQRQVQEISSNNNTTTTSNDDDDDDDDDNDNDNGPSLHKTAATAAVRRSVKNKSDYKSTIDRRGESCNSAALLPLLQPIACNDDNSNNNIISGNSNMKLNEKQRSHRLALSPELEEVAPEKSMTSQIGSSEKVALCCNSQAINCDGENLTNAANCFQSIGGNNCDRPTIADTYLHHHHHQRADMAHNTFNDTDTTTAAVNLEQTSTVGQYNGDSGTHNQQQQQQQRHCHTQTAAATAKGSYYPTTDSSYITTDAKLAVGCISVGPISMIDTTRRAVVGATDSTQLASNSQQTIFMPNDDDINVAEVVTNNNSTPIESSNFHYNHQQQQQQQQDSSDSIMLDMMNRFNIIRGRHQQQHYVTPSLLTTANSNSNLASHHYEITQQQQHNHDIQQQVPSRIMRYTPRLKKYIMSSTSAASSACSAPQPRPNRPQQKNNNNMASEYRRQQLQPTNDSNNYYNYNNQLQRQSQLIQNMSDGSQSNHDNQHLQRHHHHNHHHNHHNHHHHKPSTVMCRGHLAESQTSLEGDNMIDLGPCAPTNEASYSSSRKNTNLDTDISDTMTICSTSSQVPFCKICHVGVKPNDKLISPCKCSGTMQYIHCGCLLKWLEISNKDTRKPLSCELCNYEYLWHTKFDLRCWRFPNCSCKDILLHTIFVACILTMIACAIIFALLVNESNTYHHKYSSSHATNHTELSSSEKATLMCGALLFLSFFLAMYVQIKADSTLYKLLIRFIYLNQKFYITEYDHIGNSDTSKEQSQSIAKSRHAGKSAIVAT